MIIRNIIERYLRVNEDYWEDDNVETIPESLFNKVIDLIISLEEEQLNDDQMEIVCDILDYLDDDSEDEDEEEDEFEEEGISEKRYAKRTKAKERMKARKYRIAHKAEIKRKRKKFKRTAVGKRRERLKKTMAKRGRTPTGRKQVKYHNV